MSRPARVVYSPLMGGYEQLRDEAVARDADAAFICFTDDPTLTSKTWQIELVEPRIPSDLTRSCRALKILGHPLPDDFDETMWLDYTVALRTPPDELFDARLAEADVAAPLGSTATPSWPRPKRSSTAVSTTSLASTSRCTTTSRPATT